MNFKMRIIRAYSRKLSHSNYGGNAYETSDFFASYETELDEKSKGIPVEEVSQALFLRAKIDVAKAMQEEIKAIRKEAKRKLDQKQTHTLKEHKEWEELREPFNC
ncbi:MAG: hypothetical protein AB1414_01185 [bacterium]